MHRTNWLRLCITGALLAVVQTASAISLTVAPAQQTIEMEAGSTASRTLSITNNGETPLTVNAYAWDWWYHADGRHAFGPPGTFERSGATWVSMVPEVQVVQPGDTARIAVHVSMPENVDGGHYAVAFVEARTGTPSSEGFSMRPGGRIAVPILMSTQGTEDHSLSLLSASIDPPTATSPLTLRLTSENRGDTHSFPEFMGAIRDRRDHEVLARFQGNPKRILPGQTADMEATWSGTLDPGDYEVIGTVVYGDGRSEPVRESFSVGSAAVSTWVP